jgi:hypothetical protein
MLQPITSVRIMKSKLRVREALMITSRRLFSNNPFHLWRIFRGLQECDFMFWNLIKVNTQAVIYHHRSSTNLNRDNIKNAKMITLCSEKQMKALIQELKKFSRDVQSAMTLYRIRSRILFN